MKMGIGRYIPYFLDTTLLIYELFLILINYYKSL